MNTSLIDQTENENENEVHFCPMPIWIWGSESFISRIFVFWAGWSFLSRRLRKPFLTHSFFGQFRIIKLQLWY